MRIIEEERTENEGESILKQVKAKIFQIDKGIMLIFSPRQDKFNLH